MSSEETRSLKRALLETVERLRFVMEGSNDGFWDWDLTTGRVNYNKRWSEMLGYRLDEIEPSYQFWQDRIHPMTVKKPGSHE